MSSPTMINIDYIPPITSNPSPTDTDQRKIINNLPDIYQNGKLTNKSLADLLDASYMDASTAGPYMAARGYTIDNSLSGSNINVFVKYATVQLEGGGIDILKISYDNDGNARVDPNGKEVILDAVLTDEGTQLSWTGPFEAISDIVSDLFVTVGLNVLSPREQFECYIARKAEEKYGRINAVGHSLGGKLISDNPYISGTKYLFNDANGIDSLLFANGKNSCQFRVPGDLVSQGRSGDTVINIEKTAGDPHAKSNFTNYLRMLPVESTPPRFIPTVPVVK